MHNPLFDRGGRNIVISPSILFWGLALVSGVWFFVEVYEIVLLFFLAIILAAALESPIKKLVSRGVSRGIAIAAVYIFLFAVLFGLLAFLVPALIKETQQVLSGIPEAVGRWGLPQETTGEITRELSSLMQISSEGSGFSLQEIFSTTVGVARVFLSAFAVIAMSLYIVAVDRGVERFLCAVTPEKYREYVVSRGMEAYGKSGRWLAGQVVLMFSVFALYLAVLLILGVPGALALAVWGGLLEIVPYIGPTLAAIPALVLGFFVSPVAGILVLVSYILIQKVENYYLAPKVMQRAVGLHPLVVILVLLIGGKLAGFMGLLLAVPITMVVSVFLRNAFDREGKKI